MCSLRITDFYNVARQMNKNDYLTISNDGKLAVNKCNFFFGRVYHTFFSKEGGLQNQAVWEAFRKTILESHSNGSLIIRKAENRYSIDFTRNIKYGTCLRLYHLEMIGVAAKDLTVCDLKKHDPNFAFRTPKQLSDLIKSLNPHPFIGKVGPLSLLTGSPSEFRAWWIFDRFSRLLMDKERLALCEKEHIGSNIYSYLERMTKTIANKDIMKGAIIPCPDKEGKVDFYAVDRKIGSHVLVLKPISKHSKLPVLLIFRATQFTITGEGFVETFLNDIQKKLGELGYKSIKLELDKLLKDPSFLKKGQKLWAGSYSLGVAFLERSIAHANNWEKFHKAIYFGGPKIDAETATKFANKTNKLPALDNSFKHKAIIYVTKGDFVSYAGDMSIYCKVDHPNIAVKLLEIEPLSYAKAKEISLHTWRFLDAGVQEYKKRIFTDPKDLRKELDNREKGPEVVWYEKMRSFWGAKIIYPIAYIFLIFWQKIFQLCGIPLFRNSKSLSHLEELG